MRAVGLPVLCAALVAACLVAPGRAAAAPVAAQTAAQPVRASPPRRVLILNSYHQGNQWTDDETRGAQEALRREGSAQVIVEYMGTKFRTGPDYFDLLARVYKLKYAEVRFDVIIATDNDAFDFLLARRDEVFGKVPVTFCGVNYLQLETLAGHDLVTGVSETADFRAGLDLILQLHPATRKVVMITDTSVTGAIIRREFEAVMPAYAARLQFEILDDLEMEALRARAASLEQGTVLYLTIFYRDRAGRFFASEESADLISQASTVPVYGAWDFNLGHGILGGPLTDGYDQGRVAAEQAVRILEGARPESIPVIMQSPHRFMFDRRQLDRFGVPRAALPEGSVVINEPPSFYRLNRGIFWIGLVFMLALAGATGVLLVNMARLRRVEQALREDIAKREAAETALRESEEKYHTLVDHLGVGVYRSTATPPGRYLQANPALARILGFDDPGQLLALPVANLYQDPRDRERLVARLVALGEVRAHPARIRRRDGTPIEVFITATLTRGPAGEPRYVEGIMEDVTERRQLEAEVLKSQKLESVGLLAGGIAHDFNNLLTGVLGNISMARALGRTGPAAVSGDTAAATATTADVAARLDDAEQACLRARDLTQRLLTFARGGAPVKRVLDVGAVVRSCVRLALSGSRSRSQLEIAPDLRPVDADEAQLGQVLSNLVVNADQAMPGGGCITVRCRNATARLSEEAPDVAAVRIDVVDQGSGIRPEVLGRVFEPFFTTRPNGSGLGLATSSSIVRNHGGRLTVESQVGVGSTFTVWLPASQAAATPDPPAAATPAPGCGRVLLMDDEESVRQTVGAMLGHLGYQVEVACDGAEAVARFGAARAAGRPFHAVIMDLTIPGGLGGREAVQELLRIDPEVTAVVSSGYSDDPVMADFRGHGFRGVISKPYRLEDLSAALQLAFERGRALR